MPTRSPESSGLVRYVKRFGIKAGIIVVGAAIAIGSLQQTRFLPKPRVVEHPFSDVLGPRATTDTGRNVLGGNVEHDRIAQWVTKLTTTMRTGVEASLGKKSKYNDMIAAKLEARHMPADLIYLAMIESDFNPNATSPVKAKGLWQFMSATAREFGLTVRGKTDERTNPEKATDAALTYLNDLHTRFGSWLLAAAAYNSGGGTVSKAMRQVTGRTTGTDSDFFLILPKLPKETQDYVPKLLATARVGNDPTRYGLTVKEAGGQVAAALEQTPVALVGDSTTTKAIVVVAPTAKAATKTVAKAGAKSGASKSGTSKSGASKRGASKSGASKSGASKSGASKSATTKKKAAVKKPSVKKQTAVAKRPVARKTTHK